MLKIKCDKLGNRTKVFLKDKDVTDQLAVYKIDISLKCDDLARATLHCWIDEIDLEIFEAATIVKKVSRYEQYKNKRKRKARLKKQIAFQKKRQENKKSTCQQGNKSVQNLIRIASAMLTVGK